MKKYILSILFLIGLLGCSKNVSNGLASDGSNNLNVIQKSKPKDFVSANNSGQNIEEFDSEYFPSPVIQTFEELESWMEFNSNVILSYFKLGNSTPFLVLDEGLMQYLVNKINVSEKDKYSLIGHTNSQGVAVDNMNLSVNRARSVLEIMVNKYGLDLSKMKAIGEGETNPLNDNSNLEKRKANSRVELRVLK